MNVDERTLSRRAESVTINTYEHSTLLMGAEGAKDHVINPTNDGSTRSSR